MDTQTVLQNNLAIYQATAAAAAYIVPAAILLAGVVITFTLRRK